MRGDTTASPRATVRMAATSSAGGTSLRRKPLAPARSALKAYSSRSKVVRMSTRVVARRRRGDGPGGLNAVEDGHAHIHEDHVGPVELDEADGVGPVRRLADDLHAVLGLEDHAEALAQQRLVVRQHHADGHAGAGALQSCSMASTSQPPVGPGPARSVPPNAVARSAMPAKPWPPPGAACRRR